MVPLHGNDWDLYARPKSISCIVFQANRDNCHLNHDVRFNLQFELGFLEEANKCPSFNLM